MAQLLKSVFGGSGGSSSQAPIADADFVDYAGAPDPSPASISAIPHGSSDPPPSFATGAARPYTKWYRVWERTSLNDFQMEMYILPFVLVILIFHLWGMRVNRKKAKHWVTAHAPLLQQEFAVVGFGGSTPTPNVDEVQAQGLAKSMAIEQLLVSDELLRERTANEYITYATGRQNIAFLDVKLTLLKRYNPIMQIGETLLGFFFESLPPTQERMEASLYNFDGRESQLVPSIDGSKRAPSSNYDGFVWAIVHKDLMKRLREERYDLSLTITKDHPKLPVWATIMSESAEITETLLTADLIKAVDAAADVFEALIISDQPIDQPKKLDELVPKKRITLALRLPTSDNYEPTIPIFSSLIRLADHLVSVGRFRAEAMRRVKQTRDDEIRKIRKVDETEKAEDRKLKADKEKKEKRDAHLKNLSADEQRKFLDKEREKSYRKGQKKQTVKA